MQCRSCDKKLRKNKEEFLSASHYTNTQPLWAKDNYTKRDSELRGTI